MAAAKLITASRLAQGIAARWREQYPDSYMRSDAEKREIWNRLRALESPTPAKVAEIVGNNSWTQVPDCDGCGKKVRAVVIVGAEPDYESNTANLCKTCLQAALSLFGTTP